MYAWYMLFYLHLYGGLGFILTTRNGDLFVFKILLLRKTISKVVFTFILVVGADRSQRSHQLPNIRP